MNSSTPLSVTLKQLVCGGSSPESEEFRKIVVKLEQRRSFTYGDPIHLTEVLDITNLEFAIFALKICLERKGRDHIEMQRKIAAQYAQRFINKVRDPRGIAAIEAALNYSSGKISFEEMLQVRRLAMEASEELREVGASKESRRVLWLAVQTTELKPDRALWYCSEISKELDPEFGRWAKEVVRQAITSS